MTRTKFCDSSGLHTLLAAHKRAQAEGGELLLAIAATPVLRVLAMTSIDRMIPNFTASTRPSRKRPRTGGTAAGELTPSGMSPWIRPRSTCLAERDAPAHAGTGRTRLARKPPVAAGP